LGTLPILLESAVAGLVSDARVAAKLWGQLSFDKRRAELTRWKRALAARSEELVDLIHRENGKTRYEALAEVLLALSHIDYAAKRAHIALAPRKLPTGIMANYRATASYFPLGVVGIIGPWNYPVSTPMSSIAYALAAGNAVVFKPSELTPLTGKFIVDVARETLSIPDVVVAATGDGRTGAALATAAVDKIAFTGSTATGKKVIKAAADNLTPVIMELGGKDPFIVAEDADLDHAADSAVFGAFTNSGQACVSVERCYVVESVYDRFLDLVTEKLQDVVVGTGDDAKIGAITSAGQVDIIRDHLEDAVAKGAAIIAGGPDKIHGRFVEPTVLVDVTRDMKIMSEETFGPVLPIAKVASAEEAIELANSTPYGLGSSVFSKGSGRRLADRVEAGMTAVNSVMSFAGIASLPFGGIRESGFGRQHGDDGLREFARVKATAELKFKLPVNPMSFSQPDNAYDQMRKMLTQLHGGGLIDRATNALCKLRRS
jgi:acyl-CoA reductase-like NAD-dependent aldehyde dehydrogenase